jgi:fatty acid synthase subunit alpha, fungi type
MRKDGLPFEGFCIATGIPATKKTVEIIDGLRSVGIHHVSFKPGSVDGIQQVINIATASPDFPIIMQWTGSHASGHYSCKDFHQPIPSASSKIRQHANLVLAGSSGLVTQTICSLT